MLKRIGDDIGKLADAALTLFDVDGVAYEKDAHSGWFGVHRL